jgi:hypothetical protein
MSNSGASGSENDIGEARKSSKSVLRFGNSELPVGCMGYGDVKDRSSAEGGNAVGQFDVVCGLVSAVVRPSID